MIEQIRSHCLAQPGASEHEQWGCQVFKVSAKVFAIADEKDNTVSVKTSPDRQAALIQDPEIEPAPYLGRAGWVMIHVTEATWPMAEELIEDSYARVVAGLPKSKRPIGPSE